MRNRGYKLNHKTIQKLMKELNLKSMIRVKKYRSYRGEVGRIAPNILKRNFTANRPNQKWVTDVTEFSLFGEKLYLSPILDLFNGEIVSYEVSKRPVFNMISSMLSKSTENIILKNKLILHSDQGWHYQSKQYRNILKSNGITQSMSRKGNCLDNAVVENFFGHLKSELLYLQEFESMEHFTNELHDYIKYYNKDRIKTKLKMSPVDYRTHFHKVA